MGSSRQYLDGNDFYGVAYSVTKDLDIVEIAKRVRVNLRNAAELGGLPENMTFSVRIDRFSGGQSLDVTLSGMPDTWTYVAPGTAPDYVENYPAHGGYSDECKSVITAVEQMVNAYNRDHSNSQVDYFDVRFYSHVRIQNEIEQWHAARGRFVKKAQRAVSPSLRREIGNVAYAEFAATHPRPSYPNT